MEKQSAGNLRVENVLHMYVADGDSRYSDNSDRQMFVFRLLEPLFVAALRQLPLAGEWPLRVTDLGCATGPNTVAAIRFVLQHIPHGYREVQVFFNDLPSNDFNDLFGRLDEVSFRKGPRVYVAAVSGSFYRPLFPTSSIHLAYSVMALHWLSRVPVEVTCADSPAYNRGKVWINRGSPTVAEAYAAQSQRDLRTFFTWRAHEMAPGGVLFLLLMGRPDRDPPNHQIFAGGEFCGQDFEEAWDQLISEGMIKPEQKDSFNLPWYFPSAAEVKTAAEESGDFEVMDVRVCEEVPSKSREDFESYVSDEKEFGKKKANYVRSFVGSLVDAHIGKRCSDMLFERFAERATALFRVNPPARTTVCTVASFRRRKG